MEGYCASSFVSSLPSPPVDLPIPLFHERASFLEEGSKAAPCRNEVYEHKRDMDLTALRAKGVESGLKLRVWACGFRPGAEH